VSALHSSRHSGSGKHSGRRQGASRRSAAVGLALALGLSAPAGMSEEQATTVAGEPGAFTETAALAEPSAPLEDQRPPAPASLEDPWSQPASASLPAGADEDACSPWILAARCRGEAELLTDPWSGEPPFRPSAAAAVDSGPSLLGDPGGRPGGETASPTMVESSEPPPLPTAAEVWAHRPSSELAAPAPLGGPSGTLDSWVSDPGVPETPFE